MIMSDVIRRKPLERAVAAECFVVVAKERRDASGWVRVYENTNEAR